jgi:diguanylate cyclase (GGDEF)-like protein
MVALSLRLPVVLIASMGSTGDFFRSPPFAVMTFGTVLYIITFAFLMLSMVKERGELRHKTAALIDSLTGLANRRAFLANADELIARARESEAMTVMIADLDRFKNVNDRFGHAIGDRVLQLFADTVLRTSRATDLSGRLGGEEFAFLMPSTNLPDAARIAERVRLRFAEVARTVGGHTVGATVSIGVAIATAPAQLADLMAAADRALYRAKSDGRNRVTVIDCDAETAPDEVTPSIVPEMTDFPARGFLAFSGRSRG